MKKQFGVIKVGYSAGAHECSDEFFVCIYTGKDRLESFGFKGMYGVEERIIQMMEAKGYNYSYIPSQFGQIKGKNKYWIGFLYENEVKEKLAKFPPVK